MVDEKRQPLPEDIMEDEELFLNYDLDSMFEGEEGLGQGLYDGFLQDSLLRDTSHQGGDSYQRLRDLAMSAFVTDGRPLKPWHNPALDKPERQKMVIEISGLLHSRKKGEVSHKWLQQLPHKARKLEMRLYHEAPSLEAYKDRDTLKPRLQKVARKITEYILQAKSQPHLQKDKTSSIDNSPPIPNPQSSSQSSPQTPLEDAAPVSKRPRKRSAKDKEVASVRSFLLAQPPSEQPDISIASITDSTTDFTRSGMLRSANASSSSLVSSSAEVQSSARATPLLSAHQSTLQQTLPFDYGHNMQAARLTDSYFTQDGSNIPLSATTLSQEDMQDRLASQLIAQQQQILNNIHQQEALIRQLQGSRQQQQQQLGQFGGYAAGPFMATGASARLNSVPPRFLPEQPHPSLLDYQQVQVQAAAPEMDPRLVMSGTLLQYQQGVQPHLQPEAPHDVVLGMPHQDMLPIVSAGSQFPMELGPQAYMPSHFHPERVPSNGNSMTMIGPYASTPEFAGTAQLMVASQGPVPGSSQAAADPLAADPQLDKGTVGSDTKGKDSASARKKKRAGPSKDTFEW